MPSWSLCQVLFTWPSGCNSGTNSSRTRWWSRWSSLCLMYPPCYDSAFMLLCMFAKSLQSCPTLCDPVDCRSPGSSDHAELILLMWIHDTLSNAHILSMISESTCVVGQQEQYLVCGPHHWQVLLNNCNSPVWVHKTWNLKGPTRQIFSRWMGFNT